MTLIDVSFFSLQKNDADVSQKKRTSVSAGSCLSHLFKKPKGDVEGEIKVLVLFLNK